MKMEKIKKEYARLCQEGVEMPSKPEFEKAYRVAKKVIEAISGEVVMDALDEITTGDAGIYVNFETYTVHIDEIVIGTFPVWEMELQESKKMGSFLLNAVMFNILDEYVSFFFCEDVWDKLDEKQFCFLKSYFKTLFPNCIFEEWGVTTKKDFFK